MNEVHTRLIHPGIKRAAKTISSAFYIRNLYGKIEKITNSCLICQRNKNFNGKYGLLKGSISANQPLEKIAIDLLGPISTAEFDRDSNETIMLLVIVDIFSKLTRIIKLKKTSSKVIISSLEKKWFKRFGTPKILLSDQGRQFTSDRFVKYLESKGIKQMYSSSYNPTGNSIVERMNQIIGTYLRCLKGTPMDEAIKKMEDSIAFSYQQTLDSTPCEIIFQKHPFNPILKSKAKLTKIRNRKKKLSTQDRIRRNRNRINHKYKCRDAISPIGLLNLLCYADIDSPLWFRSQRDVHSHWFL